MAEQFAETVDAGCLHFEVGDAVGAVGEGREAIDEIWLGEAQAEDAALGAVEARAGGGDALVEAGGEVAEEGGAGAAEIGLGEAVVQLGLGSEGMEELVLFFAGVVPVEIEEVIEAESVGGGDEAVCGYIPL